ncbi:LuxR C-terminal-related transcriptional regulator [Sneathiella glossodoripedis]|uniref:LuxR C-terminal-related transcriptional regulator n=1 Tax=Sneathiella glossodoripedis TaxID=418853 RepID=UPI0004709A2D|nr:response regulator transcription factor [Sneathiella glossodoripedis]
MKIFLADDHPLYRMALSGLLAQLDNEVEVVDCCDYRELGDALSAATIRPDLILLDLSMPGMDYEIAIPELKRSYPDVSLIVVSGTEDTSDMSQVLNLGAEGFIPKSSTREVLLSAIRLVLSGGKYIPSQIFSKDESTETKSGALSSTQILGKGDVSTSALTKRQRNVLDLMAEGLSNREIANALNLAESTVKVHITAIFRILGVSNRTQAVLLLKEYA